MLLLPSLLLPLQVAAATSATMIMFTAGSAAVVYVNFGGVVMDYAQALLLLGFVLFIVTFVVLAIARLMLMHIAYKAENGMDIRQENGIAKVYLANMVHDVVDTAIQLHGALGYSLDTPLAAWYTHIRSQRLVDGPDEVHKWITGKNVIRAFKKDGTTAAAAGGDLL